MFIKKQKEETPLLDEAIADVYREMTVCNADSAEYAKMVKQLEKLYKIKGRNVPESVSSDTKAIIIGNLVGILIIVGYERTNIATSRALMFLFKLR